MKEKLTKEDLYNMDFHDVLNEDKVQIIRVLGGWIYNFSNGGEVFVPYVETNK